MRNLTPRENEILDLIASEGLSNGEIAHRLNFSKATIRTHMINIYNKAGICQRESPRKIIKLLRFYNKIEIIA